MACAGLGGGRCLQFRQLHVARAASGVAASIIAINLLALGFIVLAVGQTIASWSADLVEGRRRVRVFSSAPRRCMRRNAICGSRCLAAMDRIANAVNCGAGRIVIAICDSMVRVVAPICSRPRLKFRPMQARGDRRIGAPIKSWSMR